MKKLDPESTHLAFPIKQGGTIKASNLVAEAASKYKLLKNNLGADQTVELTCCIGGSLYPVAKLSPYSSECLYIVTAALEDTFNVIFCPVEQLSIFITVSKTAENKPPREIGFHTGPEPPSH